MFCRNCGNKVENGIRFCPLCGCELQKDIKLSVKPNKRRESQSKDKSKPRRKRKADHSKQCLIVPIVIIVIAMAAGSLLLMERKKEEEYISKIQQAREFVKKDDFDDAIKIYRDLISKYKKSEESYLELSDIYVIQDKPESALEVLWEAENYINSATIAKKIQKITAIVEQKKKIEEMQVYYKKGYDDFIESTLKPAYGLAEGGNMSVDYRINSAMDISGEGFASVAKPQEALGIISEYQCDLNGDDIPELVVIRAAEEPLEAGIYTGVIYIHIYTLENNVVTELPQPVRSMRYHTLQLLDSGNLHIFLKEENGKKYIGVLNCMRSELTQLHYVFYVDLFQVEGRQIVCCKSVTNGGSYLYDTTNVLFGDDYVKQREERNIIFEELRQSIPYVNTIDAMRNIFLPYFDLGERFVSEFTDEMNGQFQFVSALSGEWANSINYDALDWSQIPYDYMYSEALAQGTELFRLRAECISNGGNEYTQYWKYFSDIGGNFSSEAKFGETKTEEDINQSQEPKENQMLSIYQPVLEQYRQLVLADFYKADSSAYTNGGYQNGGYINDELVMAARNSPEFYIYYAFEDIDGNGLEELIIGGSDGVSEPRNYDVFTASVGEPVRLFREYTFGYRTNLTIYSDGTFELWGSYSAVDSVYQFYRISVNGYTEELIETISSHGDFSDPEAPLKYGRDLEGNMEISQAEYDQVRQIYDAKEKFPISWTGLSVIAGD